MIDVIQFTMDENNNTIETTARKVMLDQRAFITNNSGQILLVQAEEGTWDLPGGLFNEGNDWREGLEENISSLLDMQVMTENPVFASDFVNPTTGEYTFVSVIKCSAFDDKFDQGNYLAVKWFDVTEVMELDYATYDVKEAIRSQIEKLD